MRKVFTLLAALATAAAIAVVPAGAITNGQLDGNGHPYVGLMAAYGDAARTELLWRCSGTLLSPTVFLTAGHCVEAPAVSARVWFDADVQSLTCPAGTTPPANCYPYGGVNSRPGTLRINPAYNPDAFYLADAGIVILDAPFTTSTYGVLPQLNQLDQLKTKRGQKDVTFTAVGYGLQQAFPDAASWKDQAQKVRMVSHPKLNSINSPGSTGDFSMLLSNNAKTGGTCFGDSGGPNFLGTSNIVAGVTSYGKNPTCAGTGGVFRMDRSGPLTWVQSFLP